MSVGSVPDLYASVQKAIGATENLMDLIGKESERELESGELTPKFQGKVEFSKVGFTYPQRQDIQVLKNVTFKAEKDETIAIVGSIKNLKDACYKALTEENSHSNKLKINEFL